MHFDQNAFGQRIKYLRKKKNLTLEQMSSALNIGIYHLSRIELGKRGVSIDPLRYMDFPESDVQLHQSQ